MTTLSSIVGRFHTKKILVVGDIILDQYIQGSVSRISPEAPVPVVVQEGAAVYTPGGSANVANNLSSLGCQVTMAGAIGPDQEGQTLLKELKKRGINIHGIFVERKRPTALKTRIIARHQQIVRLDREQLSRPYSTALTGRLENFIDRNLSKYDAVIISDYGKGIVTPGLISLIRQTAGAGTIIAVDPKVDHFSYYKGMTVITPNKNEAENAIRNIRVKLNVGRRFPITVDRLESDADIDKTGQALLKFLELESLLITLGEAGMRLFEKGKKPSHINTRAKEVFDVTGAGDTVIAVFALSLACGASKRDAADLANFAAGIVVGKMGAVPVTKKELFSVIKEK